MREAGFTLIELMIAMVIIGILATVAFPTYTGYVQDARRAEAKSHLFDAAQTLERCYTAQSDYQGCIDFGEIKTEFYTIGFEEDSLTATAYALTAAPKGPQSDDECGSLTLTQSGERSSTGDGDDCW